MGVDKMNVEVSGAKKAVPFRRAVKLKDIIEQIKKRKYDPFVEEYIIRKLTCNVPQGAYIPFLKNLNRHYAEAMKAMREQKE